MSDSKSTWVWVMVFFLFAAVSVCTAIADDHKREREREHRSHDRDKHEDGHEDRSHNGNRSLTPVNNSVYAENCGSCHFAYQPGLLPSGSWQKIVAGLESHFGEVIVLDKESEQTILQYLTSNAAEFSSAKRSVKIMKHLGSGTPIRITETAYIREKHHEISPAVFTRKVVGSFSNCVACHRSAAKGIYDDDDVIVPR